jgi:carboxyl-terminal processing protease
MRFLRIISALLVIASGLHSATPESQRLETDKTLINDRHTNGFKPKPLYPGPDDAKIARVAAAILERNHYLQQPLDDTVSSKFLDKYLDALDPVHMVFLQSDLAEFEQWRTQLDDMTLKTGDTSPAEIIFNRFLERFTQQVEYSTNLLATGKFEFTGDERYTPNRKEMPRPKDLNEARQMWRERVRYEYLLELLNSAATNAVGSLALSNGPARVVIDGVPQPVVPKVGATNLAAAKPFNQIDEIKKTIAGRFNRQLRMLQEFDSDDAFQIYLTSLTHVYDPHSDYMGKPSLDNFNISMKLSLFGIGALLRSEDGYCKIQELMDGPAKKSGQIKPNDKIIAVAQGKGEPVDVIDMKLNKVVELIRGAKGTEVRLTIVPVDAPDPSTRKIVSLIRDEIKLEDQEAKAKLIELPAENGRPAQRLGVIDLPSFYADLKNRSPNRKSTTSDVAKLLQKLKEEKVAGVILDLRRNGGGSLEEAINLTGLFIKEGPVVQVRDPDGTITVDKDNDPSVLYEGPLVVLTSRFSASASEILAGALQDYGRALVVGDSSTHGKGTVQSLLDLGPIMRTTNELGALKMTIRKFYRASGSSTQLKGVVPDLILPSLNNHAEVGEAALPNALAWDTIPSAKYEPVNLVPPVLPELRQRSDARVAKDKDFSYLRDEIERYKKLKEEKTVSMNEALRRKEKKDAEARVEMRKKELRARPQPTYKTYELTLKNVSDPGLPAPVSKTNALAQAKADLTNTLAKAVTAKGDDDEARDDTSVPAVDITLEEARRILQDLVELTGNKAALAVRP